MFDGKYLDWNQKRIKGIIDFYNHQFMYQKTILDLGCGHADISGVLYRLGADVTAVDARQDHLKIVSKKFPGIKTIKADLDRAWPFYGKQFDMILDLDLLCHISDYEAHLRSVCSSTNHLILETAVCDSDDPFKCVVLQENKNIYDLSVNGVSARPTSAAIERVLKECGMHFKRHDSNKYNSGPYVYDWHSKNNGECDINKRRIWYCVRENNLAQFPSTEASRLLPPPMPANNPAGMLQNTNIPVIQNKPNIKENRTTSRSKKIKTAVCISGHLRTFENNFRSVQDNILSQLDCDIFVHTWDILGLSYRFTDANLYITETKNIAERINDLYHPKKMVIETTKEFVATPMMHKRLVDHRDIPGILSMYYKIAACNDLKSEYEKENGFVYDCVIRFRGDLWVEQPIPIDASTNLNFLYVPAYGNFGGLCDQFAFGNSEIMDKYASLYANINRYVEMGAVFQPEKLLQYHCDVNQIPYTKVNFKYVIKRANGLVQDNMLLERALGFIK